MARELSIALLAPNTRGVLPVPTVAGPTHSSKARIGATRTFVLNSTSI
jgi:hypothetical protein